MSLVAVSLVMAVQPTACSAISKGGRKVLCVVPIKLPAHSLLFFLCVFLSLRWHKGFSRTVVGLLKEQGAEFSTFNILADQEVCVYACVYARVYMCCTQSKQIRQAPRCSYRCSYCCCCCSSLSCPFPLLQVRQGLKTFSKWPTYPQLYIDGELIGGLDIIKVCSRGNDTQGNGRGCVCVCVCERERECVCVCVCVCVHAGTLHHVPTLTDRQTHTHRHTDTHTHTRTHTQTHRQTQTDTYTRKLPPPSPLTFRS